MLTHAPMGIFVSLTWNVIVAFHFFLRLCCLCKARRRSNKFKKRTFEHRNRPLGSNHCHHQHSHDCMSQCCITPLGGGFLIAIFSCTLSSNWSHGPTLLVWWGWWLTPSHGVTICSFSPEGKAFPVRQLKFQILQQQGHDISQFKLTGSMVERCFSPCCHIITKVAPLDCSVPPKVENFKKEVRTLNSFPQVGALHHTRARRSVCAHMCVKIVDLPSSPFLSASHACQSLDVALSRAVESPWLCSEEPLTLFWVLSPVRDTLPVFTLTQTVHCHHFMSRLILWHGPFHLHIRHRVHTHTHAKPQIVPQRSKWDTFI